MQTTVAKNAALDGILFADASLHTAYSSSGANEVAGGSPAYARKAYTFAAASSGSRAASVTPTFDVPAGTTVAVSARAAYGCVATNQAAYLCSASSQAAYHCTISEAIAA